jgi:hypothetical protein
MGMMKIGVAVVIMFYVCHIIACFWYWVGADEILPDGQVLQGWIRSQDSIWGGESASQTARYIAAYYWAITTISTVGYGDIVARTTTERAYTILAEAVGSLMFAVLIGSLGSMMVGQKVTNPTRATVPAAPLSPSTPLHTYSLSSIHTVDTCARL